MKNIKIKRFAALSLICALLVCTCGCSQNKSTDTASAEFAATSISSSVSDTESEITSDEQDSDDDIAPAAVAGDVPAETSTQKTDVSLFPDIFNSDYCYMKNVTTGYELLNKNASSTMYPASMTKAMTALICIENLPDTSEMVTVPNVDSLYEESASMAGFSSGESVSVYDLLYGILLPSGADACEALATRVAGSEEAFVALMNQKAAELGMTGTHFSNCTGLHSDDHYSTCCDIELLFEKALENSLFYEIITSRSHTCAPTDVHPDGLTFESTMFKSLSDNIMPNGAEILGGKTGTTDEAGYCLVSFGSFDSCRYILVTGLGHFNAAEEHYNITDARTAYSSLS